MPIRSSLPASVSCPIKIIMPITLIKLLRGQLQRREHLSLAFKSSYNLDKQRWSYHAAGTESKKVSWRECLAPSGDNSSLLVWQSCGSSSNMWGFPHTTKQFSIMSWRIQSIQPNPSSIYLEVVHIPQELWAQSYKTPPPCPQQPVASSSVTCAADDQLWIRSSIHLLLSFY